MNAPRSGSESGPGPEAETVFRLFSDASDTILAECSECGKVLKIPRVGASQTDGGYLVADGFKCPCGRLGRRIAKKARPKPARSTRSAETSMTGPIKGLLGMVGVAMVVWLAWPDRADVPPVTRRPAAIVTSDSSQTPTGGPSVGAPVASPGAEVPGDLRYEVLTQEVVQTSRRSLDVRLSRRVDQDVLETLAYILRDQDSRSFPRTFIVYYLPGMTVGEGGWATSHFDPELRVQILGLRAEPTSRLSKIRDEYGESLVGAWENNQVGFASTFVLHEAGGEVALEQIFPDGSARTIRLREESATGGRQFRDPENRFGEYWTVRQGNLEARDAEGVVYTARPIPNSP